MPMCHSRESGNPFGIRKSTWVAALAGITSKVLDLALHCAYQWPRAGQQIEIYLDDFPDRSVADRRQALFKFINRLELPWVILSGIGDRLLIFNSNLETRNYL